MRERRLRAAGEPARRSPTRPYKLEFQADPDKPILNIYAQAPSAGRGRAPGGRGGDRAEGVPRRARRARTACPNAGVDRAARRRRAARSSTARSDAEMVAAHLPGGVRRLPSALLFGDPARRAPRLGSPARDAERATEPGVTPRAARCGVATRGRRGSVGGDWPRTTRVHAVADRRRSWSCSGWCRSTRSSSAVSLPIDMKFDRLVLPVLFARLGVRAGGRRPGVAAPADDADPRRASPASWRPRASRCIVNAHDLNQTLEFDLAFKKITLLCLVRAAVRDRRQQPAAHRGAGVHEVHAGASRSSARSARSGSTGSTTTSSTTCPTRSCPGFFAGRASRARRDRRHRPRR